MKEYCIERFSEKVLPENANGNLKIKIDRTLWKSNGAEYIQVELPEDADRIFGTVYMLVPELKKRGFRYKGKEWISKNYSGKLDAEFEETLKELF